MLTVCHHDGRFCFLQDDSLAPSSRHASRSSVSRANQPGSDDDDEDVLRQVPLPGWSIFDALFISWHDHPEAETSGGAFTDTPIARIQKYRRWFMIIVGSILLLTAFTSVFSHFSGKSRQPSISPSSPGRLSSLLRWSTGSSITTSTTSNIASLAGYPLSAAYYAALHNASSTPQRLRPSQSRMAMLQSISKSRSSSYNPADFILNHREIVEHASSGGDPLDLVTKQKPLSSPSTDAGQPVMRPYAVSAVIVHSPDYDTSGTQLIVSMAAKYPFIREIIIWNNDLGLYLSESVSGHDIEHTVQASHHFVYSGSETIFRVWSQTIQLPTIEELGFLPPSLRIINSPSSFAPLSSPIHRRLPSSRAKHLACGLATKEVCLFLSPSLLPIHLDTLYTSYLNTAPEFAQIVAITNAGDYYRLSHLRFENDEIDLHAGIIQPGIQTISRGATTVKDGKNDHAREAEWQECIVNKKWSRRFNAQLETLTPEIRGEEADIYWSLWMNTFPKLVRASGFRKHRWYQS